MNEPNPTQVQELEPRRLYSVVVSNGYPGYYVIDGDANANSINATVTSAGTMTLVADGSTTIYYGVDYVTVNGAGGADTVTVAVSNPVGTSVHGGDGNDTLQITGSGAIWGDGGDDTLTMNNSPRGELYGGDGNDHLYIQGLCSDSMVHGNTGNDIIDGTASTLGQFLYGDDGNDTIYGTPYDDQIYGGSGDNLLWGYNGNDTFYAENSSTLLHYDQIWGGTGIDVSYDDGYDDVRGVEYRY